MGGSVTALERQQKSARVRQLERSGSEPAPAARAADTRTQVRRALAGAAESKEVREENPLRFRQSDSGFGGLHTSLLASSEPTGTENKDGKSLEQKDGS
ncbi:hypothetical protein OJAV_G00058740 [Oryzias javanicus]|uniref:Uncharacterized protein n=1 Tax=Oryzias javanicus TaxID=123683 RepID=A0A3S2MQW9_ORYJA|nr:hypothetical protein OJAV_G00058740 [Oryzias javanicus]